MNAQWWQELTKKVAPRYLIALYAVLLLALGIGLYSLFLIPQDLKYAELERQWDMERRKVETVESFLLAHPNLDLYLAELDATLARTDQMLPMNVDLSKFISQLEKDARETGVRLSNVKPSAQIPKQGYRELPIEISFEGKFFPMMAFLKRIEDGNRFASATGISVQQQKELLLTKLNLAIFTFGVPAAAPVATPGSAPVAAPAAR